MKSMSDAAKLMILLPTGLVAIIGFYGYSEWQSLPDKALLPARTQAIDHTFEAILQSRSHSGRYLEFTAEQSQAALVGAELRFRGSTQLVAAHLSAEPGRVKWWNGRFDHHNLPGLLVRLTATIRGGNAANLLTDTLILKLPGLSTLGNRFDDDARISYGGTTPKWGDSIIVQRYTYYPDDLAVEKARRPYLALAIAMGLLVIAIVAKVVIWLIGE